MLAGEKFYDIIGAEFHIFGKNIYPSICFNLYIEYLGGRKQHYTLLIFPSLINSGKSLNLKGFSGNANIVDERANNGKVFDDDTCIF